jgi:hypothetical protein
VHQNIEASGVELSEDVLGAIDEALAGTFESGSELIGSASAAVKHR